MNSRCRVTGSRTVEPQQHHSTQENGPSKASRCVGGRLSSAGRCGFGPGVHETLKQVQALYAQMIGSADRLNRIWRYWPMRATRGCSGCGTCRRGREAARPSCVAALARHDDHRHGDPREEPSERKQPLHPAHILRAVTLTL